MILINFVNDRINRERMQIRLDFFNNTHAFTTHPRRKINGIEGAVPVAVSTVAENLKGRVFLSESINEKRGRVHVSNASSHLSK